MRYRIIAGCEIDAENTEEIYKFVKLNLNDDWNWDFEAIEEA